LTIACVVLEASGAWYDSPSTDIFL
jgi:hypothetical protein